MARRIELTLPLQNHSLESVVQHQDLHSDVELAGGLEFRSGHAEAGAPIDIDDGLVWGGNLRANSHRQAEAWSTLAGTAARQ